MASLFKELLMYMCQGAYKLFICKEVLEIYVLRDAYQLYIWQIAYKLYLCKYVCNYECEGSIQVVYLIWFWSFHWWLAYEYFIGLDAFCFIWLKRSIQMFTYRDAYYLCNWREVYDRNVWRKKPDSSVHAISETTVTRSK